MGILQIITHLKQTDKQSLEGFFLNSDGTLNFLKMVEWVDEQIAEGNEKPFDLLSDPGLLQLRQGASCGRGF